MNKMRSLNRCSEHDHDSFWPTHSTDTARDRTLQEDHRPGAVGIRSLSDLAAYIARCKAHYWGVSRETQFLHWLIDREYQRCREAA